MTTHLLRANERGEILDAEGRVVGKVVPVEATAEWVRNYLNANNEYWRIQDAQACPPMRWRKGTPEEATAYAYESAMLAAATLDLSGAVVKVPGRFECGPFEHTRLLDRAHGWNDCLDELGVK